MTVLTIEEFLNTPGDVDVSHYPLAELIPIITEEQAEDHESFLDKISAELAVAFDAARKHKMANLPIEKVSLDLHAIMVNTLAFHQEAVKESQEGCKLCLINILNSAKNLKLIAQDVFNAALALEIN